MPSATPAGLIYKLVPEHVWREAEARGVFTGSAVDVQDGYIHFSTAAQVAETASRHFAGVTDLVLVAVAEADLGPALRYEPSRGGALFPHLYGELRITAVRGVTRLRMDGAGRHQIPALT